MVIARYLSANVLLGALVGSTLLSLEVIVVSLLDGSWRALAAAAVALWVLGFALGGSAGLLVGALRLLPSKKPARDEQWAPLIWEHGGWLFIGGLGSIIIIQANHHVFPDFFALPSVLFTCSVTAVLVYIARRYGRAARARAAVRFRTARILAAAFVSLAIAMGVTFAARGRSEPAAALEHWVPRSAPLPPELVEGKGPGSHKLLVIGIDGARWEYIDPLVEAGRLPNLAALLRRGRGGVLHCEEGCVSPIAWTTIFTGRPPDDHGITGWDLAISTNRRVMALWNILDGEGWTTFVSHVPSTYPAEKLRGGILAGFPLPEGVVPQHKIWMDKTFAGWIAYQGGPPPERNGPISQRIARDSRDGRLSVTLGLPFLYPPFEKTAVYLAAQRFARAAGRTAERWFGWFSDTLREAGCVSVTEVVKLGLESRKDAGGRWRVKGTGSAGQLLFDLKPGEWGPWLAVGFRGTRFLTRPRLLSAGPDGMRIYLTPLLAERTSGLSEPQELSAWVLRTGRPYFVVGAGTETYHEPSILDAFAEHHLQLEGYRTDAALDIMQATEWDAFIHHFVVTDWFSHVFAQFDTPSRFGTPGKFRYGAHRVEEDQLRAWAEHLPRAYEEVDTWLGKLIERVDDSTLIVLLSDHGSQNPPAELDPPARGEHHRDGIYVIAGPTVPPLHDEAGRNGPRLMQVDALPLILAHLGLPFGRDMPGRVSPDLWPRAADGSRMKIPDPVKSYETTGPSGGVEKLDESTREMLRSLGYIQ